MPQNKTLDKIQNFIRDQIKDQSALVITTTNDGFKVNDLRVRRKDSGWVVIDPRGIEVGCLINQRLAVLVAALQAKKRYNQAGYLAKLDMQITNLKHDQTFFEQKMISSKKAELFEDRLSRTLEELSELYDLISELEKSVGLQ
jgi:hypothetical protein